MDQKELYEKIKRYSSRAAFFVAYDKETGEPFEIIPGLDCEVIKEGKGSVPIDFLKMLQKERGEELIDVNTFSVLHVHSSPGCYIPLPTGGWK
ncbi:MAG: hypothetical protein KAI29_00625, partial [Cyclobacteriaceae bacterium]|nr:hypothetical protein [Cyclobacteriaceae bacterium]